MCCIDAFDEVIFGNVKESSLKSIIESDLRKQYIDLHNNGLSAQIPICSRCNINEDI
jgi:MoaA/NifB/PqqE/SkfB family radical SAM enzyme